MFFTPKEIAETLKVHHLTVLRWIKEGKIRAIKIGRGWRIKDEDLQKFIEGGK